MFQRRSFAQRALGHVRKIALGLGAFFLLQYLIFGLPNSVGNGWLFNSAVWPIACLIAIAYAASAIVFIQNVWRG